MAELGQTADPRALVPGDPAGVRAVASAMSRLGAGLVGAGDGLRRIDTTDWEGDAADAFRLAFEPVPDQWSGTGEAFLQAADALTEYGGVLEWAQGEAAAAITDWTAGDALARSHPPALPGARDPGWAARVAAQDRLARARDEVRVAGDAAVPIVARARDMAPPMPSVAQQLGGLAGAVAGGVWKPLTATGQFLWQVNPTRFIIEPAAAVEGWKDLGTGLANAASDPAGAIERAVNPRELATNPARWLGSTVTGAGLSALGGAGTASRIERATRAAGVSDPGETSTTPPPPVGRFGGLTASEHAAEGGRQIGRSGVSRGRHIVPREVDSPAEVREIFRQLSAGGQPVTNASLPGQMVIMPDGTRVMLRERAGSTGEVVAEVHSPENGNFKVHVPKG